MSTPDLGYYADAQRRHRADFGERVDFSGEPEVTFPPGTPVDPETGEPYDPRVEPTEEVVPSASAICNVAWRSSSDDADSGALGEMDSTNVLLITDEDRGPLLAGMVGFELRGQQYVITAQKADAAWQQRWLVYGRRSR